MFLQVSEADLSGVSVSLDGGGVLGFLLKRKKLDNLGNVVGEDGKVRKHVWFVRDICLCKLMFLSGKT